MSGFARDQERRVVPRWRFLSDRIRAAELSGDPRQRRAPEYEPSYLQQRVLDWRQSHSFATAADLLTGAVTAGRAPEAADAAAFLLEGRGKVTSSIVRLAETYLRLSVVPGSSDPNTQRRLLLAPDLVSQARETIRTARRKVSRNARNAEAWLDMARAYAILGQKSHSERSMSQALRVAPDHRMVLRAAARLYVHLHEPERASRLLSQHARTRHDPWLLASEIAIASLTRQTSKHLRSAYSLVESRQLPPAHVAELLSALATVELDKGDLRHARRHARESLIEPNDNCVAQARWLAVRLPQVIVTNTAFETEQSYEARCWRALRAGDWSGALAESHAWLLDEPYSSRPAIIGSFIGATLTEDYQFGAACAEVGLQADPTSRTLRNNLVVTLAYLGEMQKAWHHFGLVRRSFDSDYPEYVFEATQGLLLFRMRDDRGGRHHYGRAMDLAPDPVRARVLTHWLREELYFQPTAAAAILPLTDKALTLSKKDPFTTQLATLVKRRAERVHKMNQALPLSDEALRSLAEPTRMVALIGPGSEPKE